MALSVAARRTGSLGGGTECGREGGAAGWRGRWNNSISQKWRGGQVVYCPAAINNALRWRQRCFTNPRSYSWTSQPAAVIRSREVSSGDALRRLRNRALRLPSPVASWKEPDTVI